jgi:hypothetical protein
MLQRRPNTFAQTILSLSFFACDKAADHTFLLADDAGVCQAIGFGGSKSIRMKWDPRLIVLRVLYG